MLFAQTAETEVHRTIYVPDPTRPMRVAFFASGGPGNFEAALRCAHRLPDAISIALLVTDRPGIPAIDVAQRHGVPCIVRDFAKECPPWVRSDGDAEAARAYRHAAREVHDRILALVREEEERSGRMDLAVLAYRRVIHGALFHYFTGRMINQHPADLAVLDRGTGARAYAGIRGHARALRDGCGGSRTSTILVREEVDAGEILCRGPWIPFEGDASKAGDVIAHEDLQKSASDWISLQCAIVAIAYGLLRVSECPFHTDGNHAISLAGERLPYGGFDASEAQLRRLIASGRTDAMIPADAAAKGRGRP